LQKQLEESRHALHNAQEVSRYESDQQAQSEGRSRDYWTGRQVQPLAGLGATHRELNELLEQTRKLLDAEKQAHVRTRHELNNAYSKVEELNIKLRTAGPDGAGSRFQPQDWRELKGLREQTLDQSEQIKVRSFIRLYILNAQRANCAIYMLQSLIDETNRLRREVQEQSALGEELRQAQQEVTRLRGDVDHFRKK
jgi:hypothetical protein